MSIRRRVAGILLARRTAIAVGLVALICAIGSIVLILADRLYADDPAVDRSSDASWTAFHGIAVGIRSKADFDKGVFTAPPTVRMCPRDDGSWAGAVEWSVLSKTDDTVKGSVFAALPWDATNIQFAPRSIDSVIQTHDYVTGSKFSTVKPSSFTIDTSNAGYKLVTMNPFDSVIIGLEGSFTSGVAAVTFDLPSLATRKDGFGRWQFYLPEVPSVSSGEVGSIGSARFNPNVIRGTGMPQNLGNPGTLLKICKVDADLASEYFDPPPSSVGTDYEWKLPEDGNFALRGRLSGGTLREATDLAPATAITILGALLGALYGVALTKNADKVPVAPTGAGNTPRSTTTKPAPPTPTPTPTGTGQQHRTPSSSGKRKRRKNRRT